MKYFFWVLAALSLVLYICLGAGVSVAFSKSVESIVVYQKYIPMVRVAAIGGGAVLGIVRAVTYASLARLHGRVKHLERRIRHRRED